MCGDGEGGGGSGCVGVCMCGCVRGCWYVEDVKQQCDARSPCALYVPAMPTNIQDEY